MRSRQVEGRVGEKGKRGPKRAQTHAGVETHFLSNWRRIAAELASKVSCSDMQ